MNELINIRKQDNLFIVDFYKNTLDLFITPEISRVISEKFDDEYNVDLIFNLSPLNYIDSAGFGLLISINNKLTRNNHKFMVVCNNEKLIKDVKLAQIDEFIKFFPTIAEAVEFSNRI